METIKKFIMYFFMFVAFFLLMSGLTSLALRDNFVDVTDCKVVGTSPAITVNECKTTRTHGYIKGSITNDTGEHIPLKYLKVNLYDKDGVYLGSEYKELKYFNVNETINFDIDYKYNKVDKVLIGLTDEMTDDEYNLFDDIEDDSVKIALPIAGTLVLYTLLP